MKAVQTPSTSQSTSSSQVQPRTWCIVDVGQLNLLFEKVVCKECFTENSTKVIKNGAQPMGFSESLHLECSSCSYKSEYVYSSPRVGSSERGDVAYEINPLMTMLAHEMGKGHEALEKVAKILGVNNMHLKTFQIHQKKLYEACEQVADENLQAVAEVIRGAYCDSIDEDGYIDITVSYDGTWHKRGFTSHHGVGVAIEVHTGMVIDFEVLSNFCHACALAETKYGADSVDFLSWKAKHEDCEKNFDGSSKAMEAECAKRIWGRSSEKYGLRYTSIVSDGDASTFSVLTKESPYGESHKIEKLDCVNHADKRMGTALRKIAKQDKLGGRGRGRLTNAKAAKLQTYYGRAIRNNLGNPAAMRSAAWATLFHSMSTDQDPHHQRCPQGQDSWCIFNKAAALGKDVPSHGPETISTFLDRDVAEKLIPIYERMTDENLLARMTTGATQNANECLNNLIWVYAPKTVFVGHSKIKSAVQTAVTRFNAGAKATLDRMTYLGIEPTEAQMACVTKEDDKRVAKAQKATEAKQKDIRRIRHQAQKRAIAELEAGEGLQYGAGEF